MLARPHLCRSNKRSVVSCHSCAQQCTCNRVKKNKAITQDQGLGTESPLVRDDPLHFPQSAELRQSSPLSVSQGAVGRHGPLPVPTSQLCAQAARKGLCQGLRS